MRSIACGVLHDFVQPLMTLSLYIDAIGGEHVAVRQARLAVGRMRGIVTAFRASGSRKPYRVREVVDDCLVLLEHRRRTLDVRMDVRETGSTQTTTRVPRDVVCLVLLSILNNAFDAIARKSERLPDGVGDLVGITIGYEDDSIRIVVSDTGVGLDTSPLPLATHERGLGIGLDNARGLLSPYRTANLGIDPAVEAPFVTNITLRLPAKAIRPTGLVRHVSQGSVEDRSPVQLPLF